MAQGIVGWRIGRLSLLCAATLMILVVPPASAAEPAPCRVRNVTQDTSGRSLIRMVERAKADDELRVQGRCRGPVRIGKDLVIVGQGDNPTLTGQSQHRVVIVRRGSTVTLRGLRIGFGFAELRGSAILNRGRLMLEAAIVARNRSFEGGVGPDGTTIQNVRRLTIADSAIRRNRALGILNTGRLTVTGSTIASSARGITSTGTMTVTSSLIRRNGGFNGASGIQNFGDATVTDTIIRENGNSEGTGGILNAGTLRLRDSTLTANTGAGLAGGIRNTGEATVIDTIIRENLGDEGAGGVDNGGALRLEGSTVTGNVTLGDGGGIRNRGALDLSDTTVTGNHAAGDGGGIWNGPGGTVTLDGASSVTGNTPDDCAGTPAC